MTSSYLLKEAINLLKEIIRIPSFSKEESKVASYLYDYIKSKKLPVERIGNNILMLDKEKYNKQPTLLLNSHIDTVRPSNSWTLDPYSPDIIDSKLYGLGSNDAGASLITLLLTAIQLFDTQDFNIAFCASAEEEISGKNGISQVLDKYPNIDFAIVGEPTELKPAVAEKGLMVLDGINTGKSGHAARNEGINAISTLLNDLNWFNHYKFERVSPFLGPVKMSLTQINAGSQHNVVPDLCSYVVDVRGNGCYTNMEILEIIQANITSSVTPRSTRLNSSMIPENHFIYERLNSLSLVPFGSPTLSDQALMKFPSLKIGPGFSGRSHSADEYILISEMEAALSLYPKIIKDLPLTYSNK